MQANPDWVVILLDISNKFNEKYDKISNFDVYGTAKISDLISFHKK